MSHMPFSGSKSTGKFTVLSRDKNCVALAIKDTLGFPDESCVYHLLSDLGFGSDFSRLQETEIIPDVMIKLCLQQLVFRNNSWGCVKSQVPTYGDGRYFAVNMINSEFDDNAGFGHAFCINVSSGKCTILGNNMDDGSKKYYSVIRDTHNVYVWGPATKVEHKKSKK